MKMKTRILHVDDNVHDRLLVKDALLKENDGFEVVEADNREKFERYLAKDDFDLILSDFNILGFDGLQVLEIVKVRNPDLPVIIVTGTGSEEIAIQAMKLGASDYVIKSVNHIRGLAPAIKTVLEHKKIQRERKLALDALYESEQLYRSIYDNTSVAILLINTEGNILSANEFACKLFGFAEEEICKVGQNGLVDRADPRLASLLEKRNETGRARGELTFIKKDGSRFQAEVSFVVFLDKGGCERTSMVIRDLTEQKLAEEKLLLAKEKAEESDRLKTSFLQNISHEIRTPMNAIVGFSGFLKDPSLTPEKREYFTDVIIQSSNQLLSIITDIVSIAIIEAGQEKLKESTINLNSCIKLLFEQFVLRADKQSLDFRYTTPLPDMMAFITTDETKLMEVFSNLLNNALKFTKEGHVHFGYHVKGDQLEFYVEDTGIGIPGEMHTEIFKRFRQVESNVSRQFGGSGLGLSISKAYVELLGGKIWINSQPGEGSTLYFTIPYKKVDSEELASQKSVKSTNVKLNKTWTLLIAEDDNTNFRLFEEILGSMGITILRAVNGEEAVDICKSDKHIDLVLMDLKMPRMDGCEAAKLIKELRPRLPIIAQTAQVDDTDKKKAFESGCTDFVVKPIDWHLLLSIIEDHIPKVM
jgi:PAS domain S-box-containing protein